MYRLFLVLALVVMGCSVPVEDSAAPFPIDRDHDGHLVEQDCDDADANVHPGATEVCNGIDDDCDGYIDDDDLEIEGRVLLSLDADLDGWGSDDPHAVKPFCTQPDEGWVRDSSDCDDGDPDVHPGAAESCNELDDDCDGDIDEGSIGSTWYPDGDGDGYGIGSVTTTSCEQPSGTAMVSGDCNDDNPAVNPGATEVCNTIDDDCDGDIDEGTSPDTWYRDADGDGYGTSVSWVSCGQPSGFAAVTGDCDDDDAAVNPGATELCNGYDDDCDKVVDAAGLATFLSLAGVATDMSTAMASGTASAPYTTTLGTSGALYLCSGSYYFHLTAQAAQLAVVGVDGSGQVALMGDGTSVVVTADSTSTELILQGLAISGGAGADGGCVYAGDHGVALTLQDVQLSGCSASDNGGGLYQRGGTLSATQLVIQGSDAGAYGGGAYLRDLSGGITDASFEANQATYGGGLLVQDSVLTIQAADILDNQVTDAGGGLYATGATVGLDACLVEGNVADDDSGGRAYGGGLFLNDGAELTCTGASGLNYGVVENIASYGGGAFLHDTYSVLISSLCDWGTGGGDNTPDDVALQKALAVYEAYGTNETFTCTSLECL